MFIRTLTTEELDLVRMVECFVKEADDRGTEDPSQTFERVRLALEIGQRLPHPVNPLVLIMTALFHDLGRRTAGGSSMSGFMAAALAESFLKVTSVSDVDRLQIARAVAKSGARGVVPLDTVEQMVLADSIRINRLGMVGVVHYVARFPGRRVEGLDRLLQECDEDYQNLYFDESREIGKPLLEQTHILIDSLTKSYELRPQSLDQIEFPV